MARAFATSPAASFGLPPSSPEFALPGANRLQHRMLCSLQSSFSLSQPQGCVECVTEHERQPRPRALGGASMGPLGASDPRLYPRSTVCRHSRHRYNQLSRKAQHTLRGNVAGLPPGKSWGGRATEMHRDRLPSVCCRAIARSAVTQGPSRMGACAPHSTLPRTPAHACLIS